jgi:ketosteroid isomerase-like protein
MADDARNEEAAIRNLIETWASAVRTRDISGVMAHHTDDVLMFVVPRLWPCAADRETWPPFFDALADGEAAFDLVELHVTAGDRVAFATGSPAMRVDGGVGRGRHAASALDHRTSESRWQLENRP